MATACSTLLALLTLPLAAHALALDPTKPPQIRTISFAGDALGPPTRDTLLDSLAPADLLPLSEPLPREDLPPSLPPCGEFAWVHVATTFKELTAAKRNGAGTHAHTHTHRRMSLAHCRVCLLFLA